MAQKPPNTSRSLAPLVVFAVALTVRLIHVASIRRAPFFDVLMGDARAYDEWARRIADGEWIGRDVFYQAPLYPYLLGTLYAAAGRSLALVRVVQALIGAAACALLADAGRRLFSRRVGLAAGLMLALYAPAVFFDGLIQKSVLDVFFVCLALWLIARIQTTTTSWQTWLALGAAMGGLALTRENALVWVVVLAAWAATWRSSAEPSVRRRLPRVAALLGGLALAVLPVAVRNSVIGGGFYVTTSQMGPNLYIGNHAGADGTYASLRFGRGTPEFERQDATDLADAAAGRRLSPAEVSSYWTGRALSFVRERPGEWLRLTARKAALLANTTEVVDTEDQAIQAEWSPVLKVLGPFGRFGVLVPFALLGVIAAWPERRRYGILYALALAYAASVVVFYVVARYRYPLVPFLCLFAAAGALAAFDALRARLGPPAKAAKGKATYHPTARLPRPAPTFAAVAIVAVLVNLPMGSPDGMHAVAESNLGVALHEAHRTDEAIDHFRRAIAWRSDYAPAYANLAQALRDEGKLEDAKRSYEEALRLQPSYAAARYDYGNLLLDAGDAPRAVDQLERALTLEPASAAARNNLGIALAQSGRVDEAIAQFRQAIALDPDSAKAYRNLGQALRTKGDAADAIDALGKSVQLEPANVMGRYDLAGALLDAGELDQAIDALHATLRAAPGFADAHDALGVALAQRDRVDEAIAEFQAALQLRPDFADARKHLATALAIRRGR